MTLRNEGAHQGADLFWAGVEFRNFSLRRERREGRNVMRSQEHAA
jgi:hypothetical protein